MKCRLLEAKNMKGFKSGQTGSAMMWISHWLKKPLNFCLSENEGYSRDWSPVSYALFLSKHYGKMGGLLVCPSMAVHMLL